MGALMRLVLALLAFMALALAPLGMPAEARTMDDHCAEMAGMDHHGQGSEAPDPQPVKSCCTAMPVALPASDPVLSSLALHAPAVAMVLTLQHGVRRDVEVPPPRA
jgi:hypothetical protein